MIYKEPSIYKLGGGVSIDEVINAAIEKDSFSFEINSRYSSYVVENYLTLDINKLKFFRLYGYLNFNSSFSPNYNSSDVHNTNSTWAYIGRFICNADSVGQPFNNFTRTNGVKTAYFTMVRENNGDLSLYVPVGENFGSGSNIPLNTVFF